MHVCTAGMLRPHTSSTHTRLSHLLGTLFSCPQRHTPGYRTRNVGDVGSAQGRNPGDSPAQTSPHAKAQATVWQGSEERTGEVPWAWGRCCRQGSSFLLWALHSHLCSRGARELRPLPWEPFCPLGRGGGLSELYLSVAVWPKASCPLIRVLIREMAWRKSQDSWRLCPSACTCTHFCNVQTFATFCRGLGLSPPASQERGRMQLSKTLSSAHLPPPSQCPETLSLFSPHHFSPFLCPWCVGGQEGRT